MNHASIETDEDKQLEFPLAKTLCEVFAEEEAAGERPPMTRLGDHPTSVSAAAEIVPKLNELHRKVLLAFQEHGDMTDAQLEALPEFAAYGPSTIRKRRSELYYTGRLVDTGEVRANDRGFSMIIWGLKP